MQRGGLEEVGAAAEFPGGGRAHFLGHGIRPPGRDPKFTAVTALGSTGRAVAHSKGSPETRDAQQTLEEGRRLGRVPIPNGSECKARKAAAVLGGPPACFASKEVGGAGRGTCIAGASAVVNPGDGDRWAGGLSQTWAPGQRRVRENPGIEEDRSDAYLPAARWAPPRDGQCYRLDGVPKLTH